MKSSRSDKNSQRLNSSQRTERSEKTVKSKKSSSSRQKQKTDSSKRSRANSSMRSKNTDISKMMDITNMTGNSSRMMNPFEGGEGGPTGDVLHDHEGLMDQQDLTDAMENLTSIMDGLDEPGQGSSKALDVIRNQLINGHKDLMLENFDLNDLEFFQGQPWPLLEKVNFSRNNLSSVDQMQQFTKIKSLDLSNNYLSKYELDLPKIEHLNLNNNNISKLPILPRAKKLTYLNLGSNIIKSVESFDYTQFPQLKVLDLSNNQIKAGSDEFQDFLDALKRIPSLRQLFLYENDFNRDTESNKAILRKVMDQMASIEFYDGQQCKVWREQIYNEDQAIDPLLDKDIGQAEELGFEEFKGQDSGSPQNSRGKEEIKEEKAKKLPQNVPPSLDKLLYSLEAANSHPSYALDHLKDLAEDVDKVVELLHMVEEHFAPGQDDGEIMQNIYSFMQNSILLIDNHQELQGIMLSILAKLAVIKFNNFGIQCFETLKDLMQSGRSLQEQVTEVLKTEVIATLKQKDPTLIPVTLLIGLHTLIEVTGETELLSRMYEASFPMWLRKYCEILEECKAQNKHMEDNPHYDSIICLLAVSVDGDENNVELCYDKELTPFITQIVNNSDWKDMRYIPVLELIATLANSEDQPLADNFADDLVHVALLGNIAKDMKKYKKCQSLFDDSSTETVEQQMLKYRTLAAEITTIGGLLQSHSAPEILADPVIVDLIAIMSHQKPTDPYLLTAVCTFAYDLMENETVCYNEDVMRPFYENMADLKYLVPYIGFYQYEPLLEMTKRYHDALVDELKIEDNGSENQDTKKISTIMDETAEGEADQKKEQWILNSLDNLDDKLVSKLFCSIIRLIKFVCLEAQSNKQNILFDEMSAVLNQLDKITSVEGMTRENALFNALRVPDDLVKLEVVGCLFTVPIDELEADEINNITAVMGQCNNIGAGETEMVLSTIYWICTKFVQGDIGEKGFECRRIFQSKFGENTVNEALKILNMNLQRESETEDDEDEIKYVLSLSILNFIKSSTEQPLMQRFLRGKSQIFKQIMINEDLYSSPRVKYVPVDLENTLIAREITTLIETISGAESIQPYSDVSLRIIMRMADCLMYRSQCRYYKIDENADTREELLTYQSSIYGKKKDQELKFWFDPHPRFITNLEEDQRMELMTQHFNFTQSNGVALLRMFLISKFPINEDYLKELIDPAFDERSQIDEQGNTVGLGANIFDEQNNYESKFKDKYIKDDYQVRRVYYKRYQKKNAGEVVKKPDELEVENEDEEQQDQPPEEEKGDHCQPSSQYEFNQELQFEELGLEFGDTLLDGEGNKKEDRYQELKAQQEADRRQQELDPNGAAISNKDRRGDGFLNKEIRSLTIAAYLRCLFAAIEFAPTVPLRESALQNIRDPVNFRGITQLCDTTDWDEKANIGAKYLRVARSVIKLSHEKTYDTTDQLMHYETIASVIQKTLSKILDKMKKDIQLTSSDKITSYELSLTFFTVVNQSNNFIFSQYDLLHVHLCNEERLRLKAIKEAERAAMPKIPGKKEKPIIIKLSKQEELDLLADDRSKMVDKCEYAPKQTGEINEENYQVDIPVLRDKRTIQQKVIEYMVLKLFQKQSIYSLLDILFKDMNEDYKDLEPPVYDSEYDDEEEEEAKEEEPVAEEGDENSDDDLNYGIDEEEYVVLKSTLNIERIKDIVAEIMSACQVMEFELLESIMKSVVFAKMKIRESFMQDMLFVFMNAEFRGGLEQYIFHNKLSVNEFYRIGQQDPFDLESHRERIIDMNRVDINYKPVNFMKEPQQVTEIDQAILNADNESFHQRLCVLVTQGIIILKELHPKLQCEKGCSPEQFCPLGPAQVLCIKYESIETVVKFPQFPQKLVIFFILDTFDEEGEDAGQVRYMMTLNMPGFTSCAKLYGNLMTIMKKVEYKIEEEKKAAAGLMVQEKKSKSKKLELSYSDQLTQFELRMILSISMDMEVTPYRSNNEKFVLVELINCTMISKDFFEDYVLDKNPRFTGPAPVIQGCDPSKRVKSSDLGDEQDNVIKNCVYIGIVGKYLVLLKEKWNNWEFLSDTDKLKMWKKEKRESENYDWATYKEKNEDKDKGIPELSAIGTEDADGTIKQMTDYCKSRKTKLYQLVTIVEQSKIKNMFIHKGKEPSLDLLCYDADQKHSITLKFSGDFERQIFVGNMMECHKSGGAEKEAEDGGAQGGEEDDSDSDGAGEQTESDEDVVDGEIYD